MPKEIQLTQGKVTLVDDEDYMMLVDMGRWHYSSGYAVRAPGVRMHRVIMNAAKGAQIDHINGDPLDNRRGNLRVCTNSQNQMNRKVSRGESKFKGVVWQARKYCRGAWRAVIIKDGVVKYLGSFKTDREAAAAYNAAAIELYGAFATLNDLTQPAHEKVAADRPKQINKRGGSSQYKGVTYDVARNKWVARIQFEGVTRFAKRFSTELEAALAYDTAARKVFGHSATTNFAGDTQ